MLKSPDRRKAYDQALADGQMRLSREQQAAKPRPKGPDPKTPQGRMLYERGTELFNKGDTRGARAQWDLAIQFEPESEVIRAALDSLDGGKRPETKPAKPAKPAQAVGTTASSGSKAKSSPKAIAAKSSFRPPTEVTVPGQDLSQAAEEPAPVPIACPTWDKVESLYHRKLLGEGLAIRSAYAPPVDTEIPLAISLPDGSVVAVASRVKTVGPARKPGRYSIRLVFDAIPSETRAIFETVLAAHGSTAAIPDSGGEAQSAAPVPPPLPQPPVETPGNQPDPVDRPTGKAALLGDSAETLEMDPTSLAEDLFDEPSAAIIRNQPAVQDDESLGRRALSQGRYAMACDYLSRAIEKSPDSDDVRALFYIALGHQTEATGNSREAQIHFQTALKLDASSVEWLK